MRTIFNLRLAFTLCIPILSNAATITIPLSLNTPVNSPAGAVSRGIAQICPDFSTVVSSNNNNQQQLLSVCTSIEDDQATAIEISNAFEEMSARAMTSLIHFTARTPIAGDFGRTSGISRGDRLSKSKKRKSLINKQYMQSLFGKSGSWLKDINIYSSVNATSVEEQRTFADADFTGSSLGLVIGADTKLFNNFELGFAFDIAKSNFDVLNSGKLETARQSLVTYGSLSLTDQWFFEAVATLSNLSYDLTRPINFSVAGNPFNEVAQSSSSGSQLNASAGSGYELNPPFGASLIAWTDVNAVRTQLDAFQESNGKGFDLEIDAINVYVGQWRIGFDSAKPIYQSWGIIVPQLSALFVSEFYNKGRPVNTQFVNDPTNSGFGFTSDDRDPTYLDLSAGVAFILQQNISAYVSYRQYLLLDNYSQSLISSGFRMEF